MNEPLLHTDVGPLFVGDAFYFRRPGLFGRDQCGWVTARSIEPEGRWVNGTDKRGRARAIEPDFITRIKRTATPDRRLSRKGASA